MDLLKIILQNSKDIKKLKHDILCCISGGGGGGTLTDAQNGLHLDGTIAKLGGALTQDSTAITGSTVNQKVTFSGLSQEDNTSYLDGFVQIATTNSSPNATALGLSTVLNTSGIGLRISSDTGIDIADCINYGLIINAPGSGIGAQIGADASDALIAFSNSGIGADVYSTSSYAIRALSSSGTGAYIRNQDSTGNIVPLLVERDANLGVGPITPIATFTQKTNQVISANFGISINMKAAQVAAGTLNTSRIVSRLVNQSNNTSNTELWALNAGAEVQALTVYGLSGGKVGVATITTPTARLHLPAGTAAATTAPLKLTTGTAMTTAEDGALEYHTSHLYFTIGTTRFQLDQQFGSTAVSNGLTFLSGTARLGQNAFAAETAMITGTREVVAQNSSQGLQFRPSNSASTYTKISASGINITGAVGENSNSNISFSYDDNNFTFVFGYDTTYDGPNINGNKAIYFEQGILIEPNADLLATPGDPGTYPLKFVSTQVMTTAEAGAFEYNGTNLFFTRTGTTRENILVGNSGAAAPSTTAGGTITNRYGGDTNFLGDPNSWASVVISGTTYKIPLYT